MPTFKPGDRVLAPATDHNGKRVYLPGTVRGLPVDGLVGVVCDLDGLLYTYLPAKLAHAPDQADAPRVVTG